MLPEVTHVSFSSTGGAGVIAKSLSEIQRKYGYETNLLTLVSGDMRSNASDHSILAARAAVDSYLVRKTTKSNLFTLFRDTTDAATLEFINDSLGIIHLHWTPGMLSQASIECLLHNNRRIFWTLHDTYAFTGGCHHADSCCKYAIENCNDCPQVNRFFQKTIHARYKARVETLTNLDNRITYVAPSRWMYEHAIASPITSNSNVTIIPNPIDTDFFRPSDTESEFDGDNQFQNHYVIGCSAVNLTDLMKGISEIESAVLELAKKFPEQKFMLLAVGGGLTSYTSGNFKLVCTGLLHDKSDILRAYRSMNVFSSMSLAETFPTTLIEAMSTGLPLVARKVGGMEDIVRENDSGLLVSNVSELLSAFIRLYEDSDLARRFHKNGRKSAEERYGMDLVAKKYVDLYNQESN